MSKYSKIIINFAPISERYWSIGCNGKLDTDNNLIRVSGVWFPFNNKWEIEYVNDELYVIEDCYCAHYLHEKTNYPRKGLVVKKLFKGDIVKFNNTIINFYGSFYRVIKDNKTYDIEPKYLKTLYEIRLEKIQKLMNYDK